MRFAFFCFGYFVTTVLAILFFVLGALANETQAKCLTDECRLQSQADQRICWFLSMLSLGLFFVCNVEYKFYRDDRYVRLPQWPVDIV